MASESRPYKCGRPACQEKEWRIDGYCSCYCRDVYEAEQDTAAIQAQLATALAALETVGDLLGGNDWSMYPLKEIQAVLAEAKRQIEEAHRAAGT